MCVSCSSVDGGTMVVWVNMGNIEVVQIWPDAYGMWSPYFRFPFGTT